MARLRVLFPVLGSIGLLLAATSSLQALNFPPEEADWENAKTSREDPRPLEIGTLAGAPTTDGEIGVSEWLGAVSYEVLEPGTGNPLGMLYAGQYNGYVYVATDWTMNTDPDAADGGGNAWRVGTALASGPENSGTGNWYEIYVQEDGATDIVQAREASTEGGLQSATWEDGSTYHAEAGSNFNGTNWQYELGLTGNQGPGDLEPCWHWEWQQVDPDPLDWDWVPVFDGSIHYPEPATLSLVALGALALLRRRR